MKILNTSEFSEKFAIKPVDFTKFETDRVLGPTVNLGGKIWTARNLSVMPLDDDGRPLLKFNRDVFPGRNDDSGMFYTYDAAKKCVPDGWRLPEKSDIQDLLKRYSANVSDWISKTDGGNDTFGMNGILTGQYSTAARSVCNLPFIFCFWLRDENGKSVYFLANTRHRIIGFGPGGELALPIRLIKK